MKKIYPLLVGVLLTAAISGQSPDKMSYQAVIRDGEGKLIIEQEVGIKISILQSTADGFEVYTESQTPTTNKNGLVSIAIGGEAGFADIDWSDGPYFLKTETDPEGGTDYTISGTSQLLTVPYALHAKTASLMIGENPILSTQGLTSVTGTSAVSGGNITHDGGATVIVRGIVWDQTEDPTVDNKEGSTSDGIGSGQFTSNITGLVPGKTYYIRAYAVNFSGIGYGNQVQFTTIQLASVTTLEITEITATTAKSGGNVTEDGGADITSRGVVWDTEQNPTLEENEGFTEDGTGTGAFTSELTDLAPVTKYYVRAYAANSIGTAYSTDEINFSTPCAAPSAETNPASPVGITTATLIGTVNANGFSTTVTFEYGTTVDYGSTVTATPGTVTGSSNTSVSANITGLTPGKTYHYRVKAVNCGGTADGNDLTVLTSTTVPGAPTIGTATAGDNQATVTFTPPASDGGSPITGYTVTSSPGGITRTGTSSSLTVTGLTNLTAYTFTVVATNINGSGASSAPSNSVIPGTVTNPATGKIWMDRNLGATRVATSSTDANAYGHIYQWGRGSDGHQVRTSGTTTALSSSNTPGHGNFIMAPNIPYDWRSTQNSNLWQGLIGTNNPCPSGYRLPTEAEWNEERSSWSTNNAAGAYASPLKLPVAGSRSYSNGSLSNVGSYGDYWSSTVSSTYSRYLTSGSSNATMNSANRASGASVRCIKD